MEQLFDGKGFKAMSEEEKQRFLDAVAGEDGKVNGRAAAALIAAAASGGDPELAEKIVERMMSGLGGEDADIDPAMMAALMATTAMAAQGASSEEVGTNVLLKLLLLLLLHWLSYGGNIPVFVLLLLLLLYLRRIPQCRADAAFAVVAVVIVNMVAIVVASTFFELQYCSSKLRINCQSLFFHLRPHRWTKWAEICKFLVCTAEPHSLLVIPTFYRPVSKWTLKKAWQKERERKANETRNYGRTQTHKVRVYFHR